MLKSLAKIMGIICLAGSSLILPVLFSSGLAQASSFSWTDENAGNYRHFVGTDGNGEQYFLASCFMNGPSPLTIDLRIDPKNFSVGDTLEVLATEGPHAFYAKSEILERYNSLTQDHDIWMSITVSQNSPLLQLLSSGKSVTISRNGSWLFGVNNMDTDKLDRYLSGCPQAGNAHLTKTLPGAPNPPATNNVPLLPTQNNNGVPLNNAPTNGAELSVAEGVALGLIAIGTAVAVDQISDTFFTEAPAPTAPSNGQGRTINVQITSVRAIETTFGFGGDEIFLLASNGQRFPANANDAHDIDEGQSWNPNASFSVAGGVSIDLREWDSFNASDMIGNFTVDTNHQQGSYTTTLRGDGAVYEIGYNVGFSGPVQQAAQSAQQPAVQEQPAAPQRVWRVNGAYGQIVASDCRDCGEDTGIMLACQGEGLAAVASVPWVATETGFSGSVLPIEISVGNQRFTYTSTLSEWGMVGFVPEFIISPNDPIIEALQAGSSAWFNFEGGTVAIGLNGSRDALEIFKAHCGWNNIAVSQTANDNQPRPIWHNSSYQDIDTNRLVLDLTFGIPETDAVGFHARCEADGSIQTSLQVDFGNLGDGSPVNAFIQADQQGYGYQGKVFVDPSGEWAGVGIRMSAQDQIWQLMQSSQQVTYGIIGGGQNTASSIGASQAISQFIANCRPQPVVSQQPAQPQGQPTPLAQMRNYRCDNGTNMSIEITTAGAVSIANIVQDNEVQFALINVPTAVGTKYSNGEATLNTSGNTAQLMANGSALFCEAI